MLWTLWLLVIPVLGAGLFLFALGRAAAKPDPKPLSASVRALGSGRELSKGNPAVRRRFVAGPLYRGLSSQTGSIRFLAETRKRRARHHGAAGVTPR
jgi:hypothetical protein